MKKLTFFLGKSLVILVIVMTSYLSQAQKLKSMDSMIMVVDTTIVIDTVSISFDTIYNIDTNMLVNVTGSKTISFQSILSGGDIKSVIVDTITDNIFTLESSSGQVVLRKADKNSTLIWVKSYFQGEGNAFKRTNDGGFIICGSSHNVPDAIQAAFLMKVDSNGTFQWGKFYKPNGEGSIYSYGYSVELTPNGYIFSGFASAFSVPCGSAMVVRTDLLGNIIFSKIYFNANGPRGFCILKSLTGGYVIGSNFSTFDGYEDFSLFGIDSLGNFLWGKTYGIGNGRSEIMTSLIQEKDSGFIMTGRTYLGSNKPNIYIVRTNKYGDTLWTRTYNHVMYGNSLVLSNDGYFITGPFLNISSENDYYYSAFLLKLNKNGDLAWLRRFEYSINPVSLYSVYRTKEGFVLGGMNAGAGYLIKTDSLGYSGCNESSVTVTRDPLQSRVSNFTPSVSAVSPSIWTTSLTANNLFSGQNINCLFLQIFADTVYMIDTTFTVNIKYDIDTTYKIDTLYVEDTTGIYEISKAKILIYPNPAQNYVNVVGGEGKILFIYNLEGKEVFSRKIIEQNEFINLNLNSGIYLYRINNSKMNKLVVFK